MLVHTYIFDMLQQTPATSQQQWEILLSNCGGGGSENSGCSFWCISGVRYPRLLLHLLLVLGPARPFSSVYCLCFWLGLFAGDGVVINAWLERVHPVARTCNLHFSLLFSLSSFVVRKDRRQLLPNHGHIFILLLAYPGTRLWCMCKLCALKWILIMRAAL